MGALASPPVLCAQTPAADNAAIHRLARQFSAAFMRGDAAAMADLYTSDAVIFPERSERITGRDAIARYYKLGPGRRVTRHVLTPVRIFVDGDHAYDYGTYEIAGERDGIPWGPDRGKYVVVWRREKGSWRMQLDIWNSGPETKSGQPERSRLLGNWQLKLWVTGPAPSSAGPRAASGRVKLRRLDQKPGTSLHSEVYTVTYDTTLHEMLGTPRFGPAQAVRKSDGAVELVFNPFVDHGVFRLSGVVQGDSVVGEWQRTNFADDGYRGAFTMVRRR